MSFRTSLDIRFQCRGKLLSLLVNCHIILTDFYFLEKACETIQTGTVYAVFSAVGTICTALMDTLLFQVEFSMAKGLFIALLILGVISLKLAENGVSGTEKE